MKKSIIIDEENGKFTIRYLYYGAYMVQGNTSTNTYGSKHYKQPEISQMFEKLKRLASFKKEQSRR